MQVTKWHCFSLFGWPFLSPLITFVNKIFSVSYVKQLNIPSGVVGACRLDLAYEHFKVLFTFFLA